MHEIGMMQELLGKAVARAYGLGATHIDRVRVKIGTLSGVDPGTVEMSFEVLTRGTLAEGAALEIEPIAAIFACARCGVTFSPETQYDLCPCCALQPTVVDPGDVFGIAEMEIR